MSARDDVLGAIRAALGPAPAVPEVPRAYRASTGATDLVALFAERVADYRATVHRCATGELEDVLSGLLRGRAVAVPEGLPWAPDGATLRADDPPLSARDLDGLDAVLTGCALAMAETGTIVLDGSERCGRRALTLVPDHHVCVVDAGQIVDNVPAAIAAMVPERPLTLISGPSATSDIELERVEGVHGPRNLDVVIAG